MNSQANVALTGGVFNVFFDKIRIVSWTYLEDIVISGRFYPEADVRNPDDRVSYFFLF